MVRRPCHWVVPVFLQESDVTFRNILCRWYFAEHDSCGTSRCVQALAPRLKYCEVFVSWAYSGTLLSANVLKNVFLDYCSEMQEASISRCVPGK